MGVLDDPHSWDGLRPIFALLPWGLSRLQGGIDPLMFGDFRESTKATMLHDLVMKEGDRRFAEQADIDVAISRGLWHFALPDKLVRVKKAQRITLQIATNKTIQTSEWTYQLPLKGVADPRDRLHLVYVPDATWTKITRGVVAYYHGNEAREGRDIDVDAWYEAAGASVDPFATERELPPLTLKPGVVRLPLEELDGTNA